MEKLTKIILDQDQEIYDNISVMTFDLLEIMALNQIKLRKKIRELATAFTSSKKLYSSKINKMRERFKSEDKDIREAVKRIKEMDQ